MRTISKRIKTQVWFQVESLLSTREIPSAPPSRPVIIVILLVPTSGVQTNVTCMLSEESESGLIVTVGYFIQDVFIGVHALAFRY